MSPDNISQLITQLGLSAIFLFMLYKLWQRHMYMTDTILAILQAELKAERERCGGAKAEAKTGED